MYDIQIKGELDKWAVSAGVEIKGLQPVTVLIRDIEETQEILISEIYYSLMAFTDQLHMIIFSEQTTWHKNQNGDSDEILDETYRIWNRT